ncbi:hypothetical protein SCLCIDRAFT_119484 [Scleroderma citrinum Foug A]|uniref:Uncharacterized protein n=1 Tax=Scleroderma citrinum Foug A TaxID=1036808 RepID=A0A0C2ZLM6_9AGAM|nr:hypothetical protein SCLCIDRAFT_119484 [Scleroderma citrinum Foug A]
MFGIEIWASFIIVWTVQVILQMRLYSLYHCSKRLLVFMAIFFAAEVGVSLWIIVAMSVVNHGHNHNDINMCFHNVVPAYAYIWIPWFTFDAILAALAVWAGIKYSMQKYYSRPASFNRPWLISILIQGNVIYFFGWAFSCHYFQ